MTAGMPDLTAVRNRALMVGGGALALSLVGLVTNPDQFFRSYLVGFLYWAALPLGCAALLMLHHLVGGAWGIVIRRLLESGIRTFPLLAVLLLPILLVLPRLYLWAQPAAVQADTLLQHKAPFLNVPFFIVRSIFYFAVWFWLSYSLNRLSQGQERDPGNGWKRRLQNVSGPGLVLYGLTATFASIDWVMSLEPHWYSTIYGLMFMVGGALTTLSFIVFALSRLSRFEPMDHLLKPSHFHDLGNLMFAFVMLWAYISFSQFLIVWSGNLTEEIPWYLHRFNGSWGAIAVALLLFHFVVPFFLLLMRTFKRKAEVLSIIAVAMLAMRLIDMLWVVTPSFHVNSLSVHWLDIVLPVAIGGLWVAFFTAQLAKRPLKPVEANLLAEQAEGGH